MKMFFLQVVVLDVLHKLVDNRNLIFCAGNHEPEFFASLTFCLMQLTSGQKIPTEGKNEILVVEPTFNWIDNSSKKLKASLSFSKIRKWKVTPPDIELVTPHRLG